MKWVFLFFSIFLFGCYSTNISEQCIHNATRAYSIQYGGKKYFDVETENGPTYWCSEIVEGKYAKTSTNTQKAYAYMYLAKIKLRRGLLVEALELFDKSEKQSNNFPYRYELLKNYFISQKNYKLSEEYGKLLREWIATRVAEVNSGKFNVDNLEFMNIRSYVDGKYEETYIQMYDCRISKKIREKYYIEYLQSKI